MQIIVASSNVFHRELSSFILSEAGYSVHEFSDSTTLLEQIAQIQPDLVLLDVRLEGPSSLDVAQQIRQRTAAPIMFLTNGTLSIPIQVLNNYGDAHITWPYQPDDLLAHVHALLDNSSIRPAHSNVAR